MEVEFIVGGRKIGKYELNVMGEMVVIVFEIIERVWVIVDVVLVDMKIEFGIDRKIGDFFFVDVIDNDFWRIWLFGDKRFMRDK